MNKNLLITGITGFIGRHVARELLNKKIGITAIIRPSTDPKRIEEFKENVDFVKIDLNEINDLKSYLKENTFDIILHIGAVRGLKKISNNEYFNVNVNATEQLIINALANNSKFIYCSSVGVFGTIPSELPAKNSTKHQSDNYYHYTKIRSESLIQKYVLRGLNAAIIRPSITYGIGDYGFPYKLIKLVNKNLLILPNEDVLIHLTSINLLIQAFCRLIEIKYHPGVAYNIADKNPVNLKELASFINYELKNKKIKKIKTLNKKFFNLFIKLSEIIKNDNLKMRFQLISQSWYYDVSKSFIKLSLKSVETISEFKIIINWYKSLR